MRRMILLAGAGLIAGMAASATPAAAAPTYPWCARYSSSGGECSFNTREQCMEDLSGIGGSCTQNPAFSGPSSDSGDTGGAYNSYQPRHRHDR
jgi:hypothetical protein